MDKIKVAKAVSMILEESGTDLTDFNLTNTPSRVAKALEEFFSGYNSNPVEILKSAIFPSEGENMIIAKDIRYFSTCLHHLVPFYGNVDIGYIPTDKIVGLSKLPRVVQAITKRLQLQERITQQLISALQEALNPKGVMVTVTGTHLCYQARGVQTPETVTITSAVRGVFEKDFNARNEFLKLTEKAR